MRFEPLTSDNEKDWSEVTCNYSEIFHYDVSPNSVIIYEKKPVAIMQGRTERNRGLRYLLSKGGLLVADGFFKTAELREFASKEIIRYYKRLKFDYMMVLPYSKLLLERPSFVHNVLPFYHSYVEINTLLYVKLEKDFLRHFDRTLRWEIRSGLKRLEMAKNPFEHIMALERTKAEGIKPLPVEHFRDFIPYRYCSPHFFVALMDGLPAASVITSYYKKMGNYVYNTSTEAGRKANVNKALCFIAMEKMRQLGADYFLLGRGREHSRNKKTNEQFKGVNFFKRRFSTHEIAMCSFLYPLSWKGTLALSYLLK